MLIPIVADGQRATSAATAQVARIAAIIRSEYSEFWPETVRALIVHSAKWTRTMEAHLRGASGKLARAKLVRRYGFGVPDIQRALRSANDALTLVVQAKIRPFENGKMREMLLHELPWPKTVLEELGQTPVRLHVTLSYFIEPNPGRRGWTKRHRYGSHGLRFALKFPTETIDEGYELTALGSQFVHYAMTDLPPKIDFKPDVGKFTLTLRRNDDGRWLIMSDMDNENSRPKKRIAE